jgi:hypothetical protein
LRAVDEVDVALAGEPKGVADGLVEEGRRAAVRAA